MKLPGTWTLHQRIVLLVLLAGVWIYLVVRLFLNPQHVTNPPQPVPVRAAELEDRIDPNRADWPSLAALPMIGEHRARDIVDYRQQFITDHPGESAFKRLEDLTNVRGIGTITASQLEPYLLFPAPPATTATAASAQP